MQRILILHAFDVRFDIKYRFRFIRHFFQSRSKFDIHSPFVYTLFSSVLKDRAKYPEYGILTNLCLQQNGKKCEKTLLLLFRLVRHFGPSDIMVYGGRDELTFSALRFGMPDCRVHTGEDLQGNFPLMPSPDLIILLPDLPGSFQVLFQRIIQQIGNDSVLIFINIYRTRETLANWNDAKSHPSVTVSINLFHIGILFFRKELSKEEFILRF